MNRLFRFFLPLGAALVLIVCAAAPAGAQKVANPGTFNFKLTSGVMKVKDQEFGFDESQNINFNGTVDRNGAVSVPTINFPAYPLEAGGFNLNVKINVVGPTVGTVNPLNGAVSLRLRVWIKIDGVPLGGDCRIASSGSPIDLNALVTGTNGGKTGTPYNVSTGTMKIVNGSYAVPSSSSCGLASGVVNDTVGLPSPAGNNSAEFNIRTGTLINRAINPALTVTPSSGTAPFTTTLSAAGSTVSAGPATYRWDFTNDGSIDQTTSTPSTTHTYTTGGTQAARVQVVDADGDVADATRALTVNAYPDLAIAANHTGDFRVGSPGQYRISLLNTGYAATSGPVTVTSVVPAGLTYSSATGAGWSCSATGQELSCSRAAAIAPGASAPELGINFA
ncbi:MAG: PKD domain-containing protein, partial [Actinomycetota bacterium]|nr:PKD domain-containing protein [Actinomycetota bacterium]